MTVQPEPSGYCTFHAETGSVRPFDDSMRQLVRDCAAVRGWPATTANDQRRPEGAATSPLFWGVSAVPNDASATMHVDDTGSGPAASAEARLPAAAAIPYSK
jgi:hypothetical protein